MRYGLVYYFVFVSMECLVTEFIFAFEFPLLITFFNIVNNINIVTS